MSKQKLLERYSKVKDDLLDFTEEHHDSMLFDIRGYWESDLGVEELKELEDRVVNFEKLLECLKKIEYTYG